MVSRGFTPVHAKACPEGTAVAHVLVIRSRRSCHRPLMCRLAHRKCSISTTSANRRNLRLFAGNNVSLILLSLVLPNVSNATLYHHVHRRDHIPVVVLATGDTRVSGIINLRVNTSSCIAGPCSFHRLLTHVHTIVHHGRTTTRTSNAISSSVPLIYNSVTVRINRRRIAMHNRAIFFPLGRFRLLRCLVRGGNHIVAHRRLVSHV